MALTGHLGLSLLIILLLYQAQANAGEYYVPTSSYDL